MIQVVMEINEDKQVGVIKDSYRFKEGESIIFGNNSYEVIGYKKYFIASGSVKVVLEVQLC